jgi:chorismate lyase / 3-hydroxybenzoate synthase
MIATRGLRLELSSEGVPDGDSTIMAGVAFGARRAAIDADTTTISLPMTPLGGGPSIEIWRADEPVARSSRDGFAIARAGDVMVGATVFSDSKDLRGNAAAAYRSAVATARDEGFSNFMRMWNHFPEIHRDEAGLERYQAFCVGRAEGFEGSGFAMGGDLPAASGVGSEGEGLVVMFLATKGPVRNVENPRQVSAFRYPRRYGPRSPSFARASIAEIGGERQLFVSGTASIVGCESVHPGDLELQFRETMENLRAVCESASDGRCRELRELPGPVYRAYVRHPEHHATLQSMFADVTGTDARCLWVLGDICREELLFEVELWTRL